MSERRQQVRKKKPQEDASALSWISTAEENVSGKDAAERDDTPFLVERERSGELLSNENKDYN